MFSGNIDLRVGEFFDGHQDSYQAGLRFQLGALFATDISWEHDDVDLPSGAFSTDLVNTSIKYSFSPRMFCPTKVAANPPAPRKSEAAPPSGT